MFVKNLDACCSQQHNQTPTRGGQNSQLTRRLRGHGAGRKKPKPYLILKITRVLKCPNSCPSMCSTREDTDPLAGALKGSIGNMERRMFISCLFKKNQSGQFHSHFGFPSWPRPLPIQTTAKTKLNLGEGPGGRKGAGYCSGYCLGKLFQPQRRLSETRPGRPRRCPAT